MQYGFDQMINRKGTNSIKWDYNKMIFGTDDLLPMWLADMDLPCPPFLKPELQKRLDHGIFGYTAVGTKLKETISTWIEKRHKWKTHNDMFLFTPGVVPAIAMAIQTFTEPGDKIIAQPPVYNPFFKMIENNNRTVLTNPLKKTDDGYEMDLEDLESKIDDQTKMIILCNPHNPVGRVWTKNELTKLAEICERHNLIIISDEIHSDIIYKGHKHTPMATISPEIANRTITCMSPGKTFNVAGTALSFTLIPNPEMKKKMFQKLDSLGMRLCNMFGLETMQACYEQGEEWVASLLNFLDGNITYSLDRIEKELPKLKVFRPQGTYLLWLDFNEYGMKDEALCKKLVEEAKLGLNQGSFFGEGGLGFQRLNVACQRETLAEGLNRIKGCF